MRELPEIDNVRNIGRGRDVGSSVLEKQKQERVRSWRLLKKRERDCGECPYSQMSS